jgi:3D (Asp-Asp-Asp) domain-containing protein
MRSQPCGFVILSFCIFAAGCASRPLPKYEKPLARSQFQSVRTTAYTHTESDHLQHGRSTALGTQLRAGTVHSAAADWSRWPAGTLFRINETGELYEVDDYGWALSGTNTIDLYKPSRALMNRWGVRHVTIENLRWGDPQRSLTVLEPRSRHPHVARMIREFHANDMTFPALAQAAEPSPPVASARPIVVTQSVAIAATAAPDTTTAPRAVAATKSGGLIKPFFNSVQR